MSHNTKDQQRKNAKLMLTLLKKNAYDRSKTVREYAERRGCTVTNAYYLMAKIEKHIGALEDAPMLINDLLHTNNRAVKRALKQALETGDFMEYERVLKLQIEALGLGVRHTNVHLNNPQFQQQNNLFSASTEELLHLVKDGQEKFGKLLTGSSSVGGAGEDRAVEVLPPEPGGSNPNPFLKESRNLGNGGQP